MRFEGVSDRTSAEQLRGLDVWIGSDQRRSLDADEYWPDELIGMVVVDASSTERGTVVRVVQPGPQDRIVVQTPDAVVEIPFVAGLVAEVDRSARRIRLADVDGLFTP